MSTSINSRQAPPTSDTWMLLLKWVVALVVPLLVFNNIGNGETLVNGVLLNILAPNSIASFGLQPMDMPSVIEALVFIVIFYAAVITLAGYLVAADSGRQGVRGMIAVWVAMFIFAVVPVLMVFTVSNLFFGAPNLIFGLAFCAIIWALYFYVGGLVRKAFHLAPPVAAMKPTESGPEQRAVLIKRAIQGAFWFAVVFAAVSLIIDLIFYFTGSLPNSLLVWALVRTVIIVALGYVLGMLAGWIAWRRTLYAKKSAKLAALGNGVGNANGNVRRSWFRRSRQLDEVPNRPAHEEATDLVPNDLPLRSTGAKRFYLTLLIAFVLFYPVLDPLLFGFGTQGRLAGYGDAGYYVILALGLNIVVGFAGLLDLGYVAFFAIGAYTWGIIGSTQLTNVLNLSPVDPHLLSLLFWPMILMAAIIAAFWGVVLGAPTLRLRGDYLAIVTLGFGEIVPIIFTELDKYTNGTNGIVGVNSPAFFGIHWSTITPTPYYYLILALIGLVILANVRLRDSRLGRAWIAVREDEIAASSSGINLVRTKLFAFGAGAFFSGVAGAYHAAKLGGVSPDSFSFGDSVIYLAMVVIGGIGSIPGVIVGAIAVYAINEFILAQLDSLASDPTNFLFSVKAAIVHVIPGFTFGNIRNLIFGVILVSIMIFRPEGLIPSARRRRELHMTENENALVEIGSLDVAPGEPGFEAEVRVE